MAEKFYITTPIYYVNARPHIGHAYTTIVCDAMARRQRMLGSDTFFLTGTDEHGQKIERSAAEAGVSPQQLTDRIAGEFRGLWDRMKISYNDFVRYTEQPNFIRPETRRNEMMTFVRSGLRDLSISRTSIQWGIPVPDDPRHVIYVWLDALSNYCTAIGFGSPDKSDQQRFEKFWPADVHMVGKEIIRFHCVYWPAFLMAAGLPLPKGIVAHGWLLFEENKMSKSRGNIVRAETILDVLGADALRYFLLREVAFGQDGSFSFDALVQRYNSDLANDLGNLASRTLTMIARYFGGQIPYPSPGGARTPADDAIAKMAQQAIVTFDSLWSDYQFSRALEAAWSLVNAVNKYIVDSAPWVVAEKEEEGSRARLATILYTTAEALRIVTALVHPVIPEATAGIWEQLGLGDLSKFDLSGLRWGQLRLGTKLGKIEPVFPRAKKSAIERMQQIEQQRAATQAVSAGTHTQARQPATQAAVGPAPA